MPYIAELYGLPLKINQKPYTSLPVDITCPMSGSPCDGGGNRHQTAIKLTNNPDFRRMFLPEVKTVVPAVCSITYKGGYPAKDAWIVCPRRLFSSSFSNLEINFCIQKHERELLLKAGIEPGKVYGIWAEVYLRDAGSFEEEEFVVNYHFDYVVCPIESKSIKNIAQEYLLDQDELIANARRGGYLRGKVTPDTVIDVPVLTSPLVLEVMTASTSGSDTSKGTNISQAYINAMRGRTCLCPGINRRQVWGRMATQLFSKSSLAERWGGKTLWIVQDTLMDEIAMATGLTPSKQKSTEGHAKINFAVLAYSEHRNDEHYSLSVLDIFQWDAGIDPSGSGTVTDILLPSHYPEKKDLFVGMIRRKMAGVIRL